MKRLVRSDRRVAWLALVLALSVASTAAAAFFYIYSPAVVRLATGKSYPQHAAAFWIWALSQPTPTNPLLDETGEFCDVGQSGPNWYLAGAFAGAPVMRSCDVPLGKTLVLPVFNSIAAAFPTDPPEQRTVSFLRAQLETTRDATVELEIDGRSVPRVERFYEESTPFSLTLPEDNVFGVEGTDRQLSPAVDAGFYVAIAPLLPGRHTLHTFGELDGESVDVTWEINVRRR